MRKLTSEQLDELKKLYINLKGSKEKESKKLYMSLFKTLDFLDFDVNFSIKTITVYRDYNRKKLMFNNPDISEVSKLPLTVICYLITKDDEYLTLGKYHKVMYNNEHYIYTSNWGYCVDGIYTTNVDKILIK